MLALVLAAPAGAQQAPTLGAPETQTDTAAPPDTTSTTGGGGLKTWQEVLIFGAGVILLGGIAFAIVGDARDRTRRHVAPRDVGGGGRARPHPAQAQPAGQAARPRQGARGEGPAAQEPLAQGANSITEGGGRGALQAGSAGSSPPESRTSA